MSNMVFNIVEMSQTISKLDEKIEKLESVYNELNEKMKSIDESNDIWNGEVEENAYKCYLAISNDFPNSIEKMKSLRNFLNNTLNNYINSDKTLNESINKNIEELDFK